MSNEYVEHYVDEDGRVDNKLTLTSEGFLELTEDIEVDEHITRQHSTLVGDFGSVCIFLIIIIIYSFVKM